MKAGWFLTGSRPSFGDLVPATQRLEGTRREALARLPLFDHHAGIWLVRTSSTGAAEAGVVDRVACLRKPSGVQVRLLPLRCESCGESFPAVVFGPRAKRCPKCREEERRAWFAAQARKARSSS